MCVGRITRIRKQQNSVLSQRLSFESSLQVKAWHVALRSVSGGGFLVPALWWEGRQRWLQWLCLFDCLFDHLALIPLCLVYFTVDHCIWTSFDQWSTSRHVNWHSDPKRAPGMPGILMPESGSDQVQVRTLWHFTQLNRWTFCKSFHRGFPFMLWIYIYICNIII